MARFDSNGKRTSAVFIRQTSEGRTTYRREHYNIVRYNVDNESEPKTYIEGRPILSLQPGMNWNDETYDQIEIFDAPPFPKSRIGGGRIS